VLLISLLGHSINAWRFGAVQHLDACPQVPHRNVGHQGGARRPWLPASPARDGLDARGRWGSTAACGRRGPRVLASMCPPLLSGRYPVSARVWEHPTADAPSDFLPVCRLCHPTLSAGELPGSPEFPPLPCRRATVFDPGGLAGALGVGSLDVAFHVTDHVDTHGAVDHGAHSLHVYAWRPIDSLWTLHAPRDLRPCNTQYPVPGQGFRSRDLSPADRAEFCSALQ
jgi:hypothetical protein